MSKIEVPVLVVGAGPVGLMTGMFLAHWGIAPLVVEKRAAISELPRAGISLRTQEVLRSVGLHRAVEEAGWKGGPVSGIIAPDRQHEIRLVSAEAAPGLVPSARRSRRSCAASCPS